MSRLRFQRDTDRLRTVGLPSIGRPELSVEISKELMESAARRLLMSVASYVVSTNSRLEAGETLSHEGRSYRLVADRPGVLLLRPTSDGAGAWPMPSSP